MKRLMILLLTLLLVASTAVQAKDGALDTKIIPSDVQWLIHFDMQEFANTKLADLIPGEKSFKFDEINKEFSEKLKIDFLKDIYGVTVFGIGDNEKKAVVALSGNLKRETIEGLLGMEKSHKELAYGKYKLHSWDREHCGVFVNDSLVLISENQDAVKKALDVIDKKANNIGKSEMIKVMRSFPSGAFLKAAINNISSLVKDNEATTMLKNAGMALFMAMEKNNNLKLNLKLTADSAATAKNIEQIVNGFLALAKMKKNDIKGKDAEKWELLEKLNISLKGNVVTMEFSYPSEKLLTLIGERKKH